MIEFFIPIKPEPKLRARFGKFGTYTPGRTRKFEKEFKFLAQQYAPKIALLGPIYMDLYFLLKRPKRPKFKEPCVRPDIDNYVKAVCDCLNGVFYKDDGQITEMFIQKEYATDQEGVHVKIQTPVPPGRVCETK